MAPPDYNYRYHLYSTSWHIQRFFVYRSDSQLRTVSVQIDFSIAIHLATKVVIKLNKLRFIIRSGRLILLSLSLPARGNRGSLARTALATGGETNVRTNDINQLYNQLKIRAPIHKRLTQPYVCPFDVTSGFFEVVVVVVGHGRCDAIRLIFQSVMEYSLA